MYLAYIAFGIDIPFCYRDSLLCGQMLHDMFNKKDKFSYQILYERIHLLPNKSQHAWYFAKQVEVVIFLINEGKNLVSCTKLQIYSIEFCNFVKIICSSGSNGGDSC